MKARVAIVFALVLIGSLPLFGQQDENIVNAPLNFEAIEEDALARARIPADEARALDLGRLPLDQLREVMPQLTDDVKFLRRCATTIDSGTKRAVRIQNSLRRLAAGPEALPQNIKVPVYFHVIHADDTGRLTVEQVQAQIEKLNEEYTDHGVEFTLSEDPDFADNEEWFRMRVADYGDPPFPEEQEAKEHFVSTDPQRSVERALHIYTAEPRSPNPLVGGILGFATFPWDRDANGALDGVVIHHRSISGGGFPYDEGDTLVHEVGHYLGLYHTFQDACSNQGDEVFDTPAQDDGQNIFQCDATLDTCSSDPGFDPVGNFMNYVEDACMDEFTEGQLNRIRMMVQSYRDAFVADPVADPE